MSSERPTQKPGGSAGKHGAVSRRKVWADERQELGSGSGFHRENKGNLSARGFEYVKTENFPEFLKDVKSRT